MATNQLLNANCTQGQLVITDNTVSIKSLMGPRQSSHWSVHSSSLASVHVTGYGSVCQVYFLTRDGRTLVADRVSVSDGQQIARIFSSIAHVGGTLASPGQSTASQTLTATAPRTTSAWQNAPRTPGNPPLTPAKCSVWQRYRSASRPFQAGIGCGVLIVVLGMCSCLGIALASTNTPTQPASGLAQGTAAPTDTALPTATAKPTATATHVPPTATTVPLNCNTAGAPCNPWGYTFANTGKLLYNPGGAFCSYFNCIASFWDHTNGYVDQCVDGTYSHSGGVRGACSTHGSERRPLYAP